MRVDIAQSKTKQSLAFNKPHHLRVARDHSAVHCGKPAKQFRALRQISHGQFADYEGMSQDLVTVKQPRQVGVRLTKMADPD